MCAIIGRPGGPPKPLLSQLNCAEHDPCRTTSHSKKQDKAKDRNGATSAVKATRGGKASSGQWSTGSNLSSVIYEYQNHAALPKISFPTWCFYA